MGNGRGLDSSSRNASDLLAEFKATGRQEAFEEIVRRYAAMVFGVCLKTTRNAHDAEDATQAAFLTLAVQCKTDKAQVLYIGPWLQKVARRISLDLRRSRKRREIRETNHAAGNARLQGNGRFNGNAHATGNGHGGSYHDNGHAGIDVEELKAVLNEELNQLPAKYRMPMILHYYGGLTRDQIARELGCKPSTLGVRIHRGRQMLAKRLTDRGASPIAMGMSLAVGLSLAVRAAVSDGMVASTSTAAAKLMAGEELGAIISAHVLSVAHGAAGAAMLAKLKLVASIVVAAVVLGAGAGATAKVLPLDQLRLQWPVSLDGFFRLPSLRSPFRAPRAGAAPAWSDKVAVAASTAAQSSPVRTVMWLAAEGDGSRNRPRAPGGTPGAAGGRGGGGLTGIGATGRLLARVVSSVVSTSMSNPSNASKDPSDHAPPAPAAAPTPAPERSAVALVPGPGQSAMFSIPAPLPNATRQSGATHSGNDTNGAGGRASLSVSGDVVYSDRGSVRPLRPPAGMSRAGDAAAGASGPSALPLPPRTQVAAAGPAMTVGGAPGSRGKVSLKSGRHEAAIQTIGGAGRGEFEQTGGINVAEDVRLGAEPGSVGQYVLDGGELVFKPARPAAPGELPRDTGLEVGGQGTGVFLLGNARTTGEIYTRSSEAGSSLVIRGDPLGTGIFKGWGSVSMGGYFDHSGQAIADGYGMERDLEFRGFRYVGNGIENPAAGGTAGWFARDHGRLVLPAFRVRPGTAAYTWGEDPGDPTLDLVNSARLTLHDVAKPGLMTVALLSNDHADVPTLPNGHTFIGVWEVDAGGLNDGAVDLTVRYDDGMARELGLNENSLKLWRYSEGEWLRINDASFWRDVELNLIGGTAPPGGLDFFAVSAPEPGTLGAAFVGAAIALLRRPRRRVRAA